MENNIPFTQIGDLRIQGWQGGMGVGVSQAGLASAVANEGWAGIIASVGLGALKGYFTEQIKMNHKRIERTSGEERRAIFDELYARANKIALIEEIREARRRTNGVIGVNIMHALSDYSSLVEGAIEAEADLIISGAGLPLDLPKYLKSGSKTKLIPIVSSARAAQILKTKWAKNYHHAPDAVVVEGPLAGGHLGYSYEQLADSEFVENGLEGIVRSVISVMDLTPVIAAGGIWSGQDIRKARSWGAAGVQMATRFVTTYECDASIEFKQEYLDCDKEDLRIIKSPVGMPGRAITNEFLDRVENGEMIPTACSFHCLKTCIPAKSPYCIAYALTSALKGNFKTGYVFAGANAWRNKEDGITTIKEVIRKLNEEYNRE
ncbi:MAG: nitronate monooxygenase [Nanoarchaeota archaeon]